MRCLLYLYRASNQRSPWSTPTSGHVWSSIGNNSIDYRKLNFRGGSKSKNFELVDDSTKEFRLDVLALNGVYVSGEIETKLGDYVVYLSGVFRERPN